MLTLFLCNQYCHFLTKISESTQMALVASQYSFSCKVGVSPKCAFTNQCQCPPNPWTYSLQCCLTVPQKRTSPFLQSSLASIRLPFLAMKGSVAFFATVPKLSSELLLVPSRLVLRTLLALVPILALRRNWFRSF